MFLNPKPKSGSANDTSCVFTSILTDMFRKIAASWLTELEDGDIEELFAAYMDTGVFTEDDPSIRFAGIRCLSGALCI